MGDVNVDICRSLLSEIHKEVKAFNAKINLKKDAWVYSFGRTWEFHGPDEFYWHGRAANAYDARYKGWSAYLEKKGRT